MKANATPFLAKTETLQLKECNATLIYPAQSAPGILATLEDILYGSENALQGTLQNCKKT